MRSKGMRPPSCTVVIPLNAQSTLEIKTTAEHALEIVSGQTLLPAKNVRVFDADNKELSKRDLTALARAEGGPREH